MNEVWTVSVTRKYKCIIWQVTFKVCWIKMTMSAVPHIILEVKQKIFKKKKGSVIKLWLSNHTHDHANLYLHNNRLLLPEKKK